jgi:hypothetical protein
VHENGRLHQVLRKQGRFMKPVDRSVLRFGETDAREADPRIATGGDPSDFHGLDSELTNRRDA